MCLLNFILFFKINYKCSYGEAVYVVGNIPQLGCWDPARALKLRWTDGHNWTQKLFVIHDNTKTIQYKYIIAPDNITLPHINHIQWEAGMNHYLNLLTVSSLSLNLEDEWEHATVEIALSYDAIDKYLNNGKLILHTDLGSPNDKHEMKLEKYTRNCQTKEEWFWVAKFSVSNCISGFHYKYKVEAESGKEIWLDSGERKFLFCKFSHDSPQDECYSISGSIMTKSDFDLKTSLSYNTVTNDILVGTFPQDSKDVQQIANLGVKGVLNLQTLNDMQKHGTDWESLQKSYEKTNIKVEHFPIRDMNPEDLSKKMIDVASVLNKLLENGKVYVHCTAGKFRSPNVITWYLCHYRDFTPREAMELMIAKRRKAKIIKELMSKKEEKPMKSVASKELSRA